MPNKEINLYNIQHNTRQSFEIYTKRDFSLNTDCLQLAFIKNYKTREEKN